MKRATALVAAALMAMDAAGPMVAAPAVPQWYTKPSETYSGGNKRRKTASERARFKMSQTARRAQRKRSK